MSYLRLKFEAQISQINAKILRKSTAYKKKGFNFQIHIKEAVKAAACEGGECDSVPEDLLPSPSDHDMILLIAACIVNSRPMHLMSTLHYADLFAWSVPIDMM